MCLMQTAKVVTCRGHENRKALAERCRSNVTGIQSNRAPDEVVKCRKADKITCRRIWGLGGFGDVDSTGCHQSSARLTHIVENTVKNE